ncbi:MAG: hypothetical protein ACRDZR_07945 [Acidimicrobiales bacterium]
MPAKLTRWLEQKFGSLAEAEPPHRTSFHVGDRFYDRTAKKEFVIIRFDVEALPYLGLARNAVLQSTDSKDHQSVPEVELLQEKYSRILMR